MSINPLKTFSFWFGFGAPLYFFGALLLIGQKSLSLGAVVLAAYCWRVYQSFDKTCSRCPNYNSWTCGVPGKLVAHLMPKKSTRLSKKQIQTEAVIDWTFMIGVYLLAYLPHPIFRYIAWIWPLLAYVLVYKPKRFHGLLHSLK